MAKKQSETVYRIIDVVGVSEKSWEGAGRVAVETAASSLRGLRIAEVTKMDMKVDNGKVTAFRTRVALSLRRNSGHVADFEVGQRLARSCHLLRRSLDWRNLYITTAFGNSAAK
jgi:dodecin